MERRDEVFVDSMAGSFEDVLLLAGPGPAWCAVGPREGVTWSCRFAALTWPYRITVCASESPAMSPSGRQAELPPTKLYPNKLILPRSSHPPAVYTGR